MKIQVKAKTRAKEEKVERLDRQLSLDGQTAELPSYKVSVKDAPERGKANAAIARVLAEYFHAPSSNVRLLAGHTSKNKVFEIID